jgi:multidrug efflux pump subunit AcrB
MKPDLSGAITRATIRSPLTPLFLLSALAVGLIALLSIPREEEPQISVPMVDITVSAPGLRAADATEQVTKPLESILMAIPDVEHVYSQTRDDGALVTARFAVGTDADNAILRVHEKIRANLDSIPYDVPMPLVVGRGINDVPIVSLTLSPRRVHRQCLERYGPADGRGRAARRADQGQGCRPDRCDWRAAPWN